MATNGCDGVWRDQDGFVDVFASCHVCLNGESDSTDVAIRTWCFARKEIKLGQWKRRNLVGRMRLRECGKASCKDCA